MATRTEKNPKRYTIPMPIGSVHRSLKMFEAVRAAISKLVPDFEVQESRDEGWGLSFPDGSVYYRGPLTRRRVSEINCSEIVLGQVRFAAPASSDDKRVFMVTLMFPDCCWKRDDKCLWVTVDVNLRDEGFETSYSGWSSDSGWYGDEILSEAHQGMIVDIHSVLSDKHIENDLERMNATFGVTK